MLVSVDGWRVSVAVVDTLLKVAVIVAELCAETPAVVTVNAAVVAPADTVTEVGTPVDKLFELIPTTTPPLGDGRASVTVPMDELPP